MVPYDLTILESRLGSSLKAGAVQSRLLKLRQSPLHRPRYMRRALLRRLTAAVSNPLLPPALVPGDVVRGRVVRMDPDGTAHVQIGHGGPVGVLPRDAQVTPSRSQGQLRRGMVVWVAVMDLRYEPDTLQVLLTQRAAAIPAAVLAHVARVEPDKVELRVIHRRPGYEATIAVGLRHPAAQGDDISPVSLVVGRGGRHVRRAGWYLQGERIRVVPISGRESSAGTGRTGRPG